MTALADRARRTVLPDGDEGTIAATAPGQEGRLAPVRSPDGAARAAIALVFVDDGRDMNGLGRAGSEPPAR